MFRLDSDSRFDKIISYMEKEGDKTIYLLTSDDKSISAKYCRRLKYPYIYNVPSDIIDNIEKACSPLSNYRMLYYRKGYRRPYIFKCWALVPFEPKSIGCYIWQLTMLGK